LQAFQHIRLCPKTDSPSKAAGRRGIPSSLGSFLGKVIFSTNAGTIIGIETANYFKASKQRCREKILHTTACNLSKSQYPTYIHGLKASEEKKQLKGNSDSGTAFHISFVRNRNQSEQSDQIFKPAKQRTPFQK
jgi:hypothetical protein